MVPFRVTESKLDGIFKKLRKGRGSPDGLTAEMYAALPHRHVQSLAAFLTTILATLTIPLEWTNMLAVFIPKVLGAAGLG
eukprot:10997222-Alexandrium_andersonii.AAC.1